MPSRSKRDARHLSPDDFLRELKYQARTLGPQETRQLSPYIPNSWYEDHKIVPADQKAAGSGFGYVQSPFSDLYSRMWGVEPIKDLPKYAYIFDNVPVANRAVVKTAMLAVSKGFVHEFDEKDNVPPEKQKEILACIEEFWNREDVNQIEYLITIAKDLLKYGWHVSELCYDGYKRGKSQYVRGYKIDWLEPMGDLRWLKPLDPLWMRIQRDSFGNRHGFLQFLTTPPTALTNEKIAYFIYSPSSDAYTGAYGTSMFKSLIRTQDLIWTVEADLAVMTHAGAKPPMIFKGGTTDMPMSWSQLSDLQNKTAARGPGSDIYVPANVEVAPSPQPQTMIAGLIQYLDYLKEQRIILLGVPPQLLGVPEGSTRTTAEVSQTDFIIMLQALQMAIGEGLRYQVYKRLLTRKFGDDCPIPKLKWHEIFETDMRLKVSPSTTLYKFGIISLNECRVILGLEPTADENDNLLKGPLPMGIGNEGQNSGGDELGMSASALPPDWPSCAHMDFLGHIDEYEVWVVDSATVAQVDKRWGHAKDYILGNNHYGQISYYIPERELWISDRVPVRDRQKIARHEYVEAILIRGGMPYEEAHQIATEEESKVTTHTVVARRTTASLVAIKKNLNARPYDRQLNALEKSMSAKIAGRIKRKVDSFLEHTEPLYSLGAGFVAQDDNEDYDDIEEELEESARLGYNRADFEVGIAFNYDPEWAKTVTAESFPYIDKMDHELAEELADSIRHGRDWREVADDIRDRVEPKYVHRAETIAKEEISRVYRESYRSTINKSGISGKFVFRAMPTACDECLDADGEERDDMPHIGCYCYIAFVPAGATDSDET